MQKSVGNVCFNMWHNYVFYVEEIVFVVTLINLILGTVGDCLIIKEAQSEFLD